MDYMLKQERGAVNFGQKIGYNNRNILSSAILNGEYGNKRDSGHR
jgi:hypothetical protein